MKPYKVIDLERNMFEGLPHFIIPKATDPAEVDRRIAEPGTTGPRAEQLGIVRAAEMLKVVPASDHQTFRYLTTNVSFAAIGTSIYDVYPEQELGISLSGRTATQRKKGELPDVTSRDPFDLEQRPTGLDMIGGAIERFEAAAEIAAKLINIKGMDLDIVRKKKIDMGKLIGDAAMHLACWRLAEGLSYGEIQATDFTASHLARETSLSQKAKAVKAVEVFKAIPSLRQFAVEFSHINVDGQNSGIAGVKIALGKTTKHLLPS